MAKNVFIAPGSREHINRSVMTETTGREGKLASLEGLIPIDAIADTLSEDERARLDQIYPDKKVRMWGARPNLKTTWGFLNENDYVLFYSNNYYICAAECAFKTRNSKLAEKVWGKYKTGETWEYVFFLKNIKEINMSRKDFNKIAGYSEDFVPQGFMRVQNEQARNKIVERIVPRQLGEIFLSEDAEKFIENFKKDPKNREWLEKKIRAFDKWRTAFRVENVPKLTKEEFKAFLNWKENQSWDRIDRQPGVYENMSKLRQTINYLVSGINDLTLEQIGKRLDDVLEPSATFKIKGLDRAVVTGIIHICDIKNRLGVWNSKVDGAFKKLGISLPELSKTRGERYLVINNILNFLGKKYDLSLYQVDMLMHKIVVEYTPGKTIISSAFSFTTRDFKACTGKKTDARYLSERFKTLLDVLTSNLGPDLQEFTKGYSARPFNQGSKKYRKNMWLGLAHNRLRDKPQKSVQFQVSINPYDPFSMDIFLDSHAQEARAKARSNIGANKALFLQQLNSLEGYVIGYSNEEDLEFETGEVSENDLDKFLDHIDRAGAYVYISKRMTRRETIGEGESIVGEILRTWEQLLPLYGIAAFGKVEKPKSAGLQMSLKGLLEKEREFSDIIKASLAHLAAGKNLVFYGAPATSKTYLAMRICESFCYDFSFHTANSEWSYFDIVGGFVPQGNQTRFKKGILLEATEECQKSVKEGRKPCWLIIDELNRANLDLAFGKIFTQLDLAYRNNALEVVEQDGNLQKYLMPASFRILATMNTYDRSLLFSLGYAFMRRFAFIPIESLLKEKPQSSYASKDIETTERMRSILERENIKRLKDETKAVVFDHFLERHSDDKPFVFAEFALKDKSDVDKMLGGLKIGDLDILDVLLYIAYEITNTGLVEIGHAIVFDSAKFMVARSLLSPEGLTPASLLDETIEAYLLPQFEYFMPKLRKMKIFEKKEIASGWEAIKQLMTDLNLIRTTERLKQAEEEFRVIH